MRIGARSRIARGVILLLAGAILGAGVPATARCGESRLIWDNLFDSGGGNDETTGVAADAAGGVIVVANVATGGIRVRRFSGEGAFTWSVSLPGVTIPLDRYFKNANPPFFPNGDVLIVGQATTGSTPDVYVGRFQSATGALVWDNTFDLGGIEEPRCGLVDASGNIVVVGQMLDPGPDHDFFTLKIDGNSRSVAWITSYSGTVASQVTDDRVTSAYSAASAANGDVVVSGYQFNDVSNGDDLVVRRYASADGADLGGDALDFGDDDKAYAAAITGDGPIFVVGRTRQPGEPYGAIVLKYASLSPPDRLSSIDNVNSLGAVAVHVLVEGNDNVLVGIEASTATDQEVVVRKLRASDLAEIWTYRYDVPGAGDSLKGMAFDSRGHLVALVQTANDNIGVLTIDRQGNQVDNVFLSRAGIVGVGVAPSGPYVFAAANSSNGTDQDSLVAMVGPPPAPAPPPAPSSGSGGGCFIATASWGSPLQPEVSVLRRFRDSVLATTVMGRGFISLYYRWSPTAAHFIERSDLLRGAVRFLLVPVVMGVGIALAPVPASVSAIFLFCSIVTILFRKRKGFKNR